MDKEALTQAAEAAHVEAVEHGQASKVFVNGNSQAVRIPKSMQLEGKSVRIVPMGKGLYIEPVPENSNELFLAALNKFTPEFMSSGREEFEYEDRRWD